MRACLRESKDKNHFVHIEASDIEEGEPDIIMFEGKEYIFIDLEHNENDDEVLVYRLVNYIYKVQ